MMMEPTKFQVFFHLWQEDARAEAQKILPDQELDQLLRLTVQAAKGAIESGGSIAAEATGTHWRVNGGPDPWSPMMHVLGRHEPDAPGESRVFILQGGWPDEFVQRAAITGLGQLTYRAGLDPVATFLVTEAWWAEVNPEVLKAFGAATVADLPPMEERPDKREILLVQGSSVDGRVVTAELPTVTIDHQIQWIGEPTFNDTTRPDDLILNAPLLDCFWQGTLVALLEKHRPDLLRRLLTPGGES